MIRRPPRSTQSRSSAASDVYKRQLILTSINVRTLPVAIATFVTDREILWGQMSAAGVLSIVPVIIFTMIIQKQLIRGLTLGAIKE